MKTVLAALTTLALCLPSPVAANTGEPVTASRSETLPLAPAGTVTIDRTWGEMTIEAWDRPSVEVSVTARSKKDYPEAEAAAMRERLESFGFDARAKGADGVTVTGLAPSAGLLKPFGGKSGVNVSYTVRMPRGANLVLRHGIGEVAVRQVTGNLDIDAKVGDLRLAVPIDNAVSVEASSGVGEISVKQPLLGQGQLSRRALVGQTFSARPDQATRQVVAHVGIGSIAID